MKKAYCYTAKLLIDNIDSIKIGLSKISDAILGYIFSYKDKGLTLDLYISKLSKEGLSESSIIEDYYKFCKETNLKSLRIFKNPDINEWIITKDNWCRSMARLMSKKYGLEFEEALSNIYFTISCLYNKNTVYMGNLKYISKAIESNIQKNYYANRNKLTLDNINVKSLYTTLNAGDDDKLLTLEDVLGKEDNYYAESDFADTLEEIKASLRLVLSNREIEQILNLNGTGFLPKSTYNRLLEWRKKHKYSDFVQR